MPRVAKNNQSGAVLLLSLMLLSLVMFSTLSLATILLTELRSARFFDNSIVAHYAAESGSEQALFLLKEARSIDELGGDYPYNQLFNAVKNHRVDGFVGGNPDVDRRYEFTKISTTSDTFTAYNIPLNSSVQLDIFDPLQEYELSPQTNVENIQITWEVPQCAVSASDKLELTVLSYVRNNSGSIEVEQVPGGENPSKYYYVCNCSNPSTVCAPRPQVLPSNRFYHLSLRPIDGAIKKVSVTATNSNAVAVGIPSQIFIKTTGRFRDSSQEVVVQTPWDNGTSDLFNYVIFSDASLIKNILDTTVEAFPSMCGVCQGNPSMRCSDNTICGGVGTFCCVPGVGTCPEVTPAIVPACTLDPGNNGENDSSGNITQNNYGLCNARCSGYTYCGDSTMQSPNGVGQDGLRDPANPVTGSFGYEACDDGNISNTDRCTVACVNTYCGDGYVNQPNVAGVFEECDERVACGGGVTLPCKSDTVVGACKTDCSGYVSGSPEPCRVNCHILE